MEKLIPTKHKDKLPKGFSYLFKAKEISEWLDGVPQYSLIELSFCDRGEYWQSKYQRVLKNEGEIELISSGYDLSKEKVSVNIYGIPSQYRHKAREKIQAVGLPDMLEWFQYPDKHKLLYQEFGIYFTLSSETVRIK